MLKKRHIKIYVGETGQETIFESKMNPKSMRIDFEIKKYCNGISYGMNTCSVKLFNVTDETFKALNKKQNPIVIYAGYEGEENIVFNGRCSNVLRIKESAENPDVVVNLLCSSGLKNITQAVYSQSFKKTAAGSPSLELHNFVNNLFKNIKIIKENGIEKTTLPVTFIPKINNIPITGNIDAPHTFNSPVLEIMRDLGQKYNFNFQVEEAGVVIVPREMDPTQIKITPESGLIGIPEITEMGIDFKTFLNPQLQSGYAFTLESKYSNFKLGALEFLDRIDTAGTTFNKREPNKYGRYEGSYRILSLIHKGSSHTNEWQTEITSQNYTIDGDVPQNM